MSQRWSFVNAVRWLIWVKTDLRSASAVLFCRFLFCWLNDWCLLHTAFLVYHRESKKPHSKLSRHYRAWREADREWKQTVVWADWPSGVTTCQHHFGVTTFCWKAPLCRITANPEFNSQSKIKGLLDEKINFYVSLNRKQRAFLKVMNVTSQTETLLRERAEVEHCHASVFSAAVTVKKKSGTERKTSDW